jgi:hypothetical protein
MRFDDLEVLIPDEAGQPPWRAGDPAGNRPAPTSELGSIGGADAP